MTEDRTRPPTEASVAGDPGGYRTSISGGVFTGTAIATGSGNAQVSNHGPAADPSVREAVAELKDLLVRVLAAGKPDEQLGAAQAMPEVVVLQTELDAEPPPDPPTLTERVTRLAGLLTGVTGAVEVLDRLTQAIGRLPGL
jgi:hypothetical protein